MIFGNCKQFKHVYKSDQVTINIVSGRMSNSDAKDIQMQPRCPN